MVKKRFSLGQIPAGEIQPGIFQNEMGESKMGSPFRESPAAIIADKCFVDIT